MPDDNLLILVTGSQGEPRSALARIAADTHPRIELGEGDTVVFSSRMIPGNERAIGTVQDNLVRRGVRVMTDDDHMIHVSGHPGARRVAPLVSLVRPRFACRCMASGGICRPMRRWRRRLGVTPILLEDGDILSLAPGGPRWSTARPSGAWCWTATGWCRCRAASWRPGGACCSTALSSAASRSTPGR